MFHWMFQTRGVTFLVVGCSCALCHAGSTQLAPNTPPNGGVCLYPGVGWASCMRVHSWASTSSVLPGLLGTLLSLGRSEKLRRASEDYFRRKRCAKMAASSGLTGWASWPRRLTGGMLPYWRLVRKLLASWIVFFSSANRSCWRM